MTSREKMHSYYTEIPLRSFDATVKNGWLSEVLTALLVDPLEAEDVAETLARSDTTYRMVFSLRDGVREPVPISLEYFMSLPSKSVFERLKITVAQWIMTQPDAMQAAYETTAWDQRFGVWCTCQAVRVCLPNVRFDDPNPSDAIAAAERWVIGLANVDAVNDAANKAIDSAVSAEVDGDVAASSAADAAAFSANAALGSGFKAAAYANDAISSAATSILTARRQTSRVTVSVELRDVMARSCLTFPG